MMTPKTDRLALPLLAVAQAQKELTHNEAIAALDALVQPVVVAVASAPPSAPAVGQCWLIDSGASGAWTGESGKIAAWTQGGWRFHAPFDGMSVWSITDRAVIRRMAGNWSVGIVTGRWVEINGVQVVGTRNPAIANPAGGGTVDSEARAAVSAVLAALRNHGLIQS